MQNQLHIALEHSKGIIVFSLDREYRYTSFSRSHFDTMKFIWNREIALGTNMLDFIQEIDKEKAKNNFDRALRGESFVLVEEYGDENLDRSFWENRYDPIFDAQGHVCGLVVFVLNVSSHIRLCRELEMAQNRLEVALMAGRTGVFEWSLHTNEVYWSDVVFKIFGVSQDAFVPTFQSYMALIHPEDRPWLEQKLADHLTFNEPYKVEHRILRPSGELRWIYSEGVFRLDAQGRAYMLAGIVYDITDRKEFENQLVQKTNELQKLNDELDRFVYSASHDLRAPLASLLGLIKLARVEKDSDKLLALLDMQEKSLHRMDGFIRDIIDYSHNSRMQVVHEPIDFEQIIAESYEQLHFYENMHKIQKDTLIDLANTQVVMDRKRLQIIFNNLLSNAIKYSDPDKQQCCIFISVKKIDSNIVIEVKDNGIGIPPVAHDKIFTMFFRATSHSKGSGIGLYIVKEVVTKLHGTISFSSEILKGTTFKVILPLNPDDQI